MKHNGVILYGVNWKAAVADDTSQSLCVTSLLRLELVYHKANTTIMELCLAQNSIGSAGAAALADALKATLAMCFFRVRATCSSDLDSHSVASRSSCFRELSTLLFKVRHHFRVRRWPKTLL